MKTRISLQMKRIEAAYVKNRREGADQLTKMVLLRFENLTLLGFWMACMGKLMKKYCNVVINPPKTVFHRTP